MQCPQADSVQILCIIYYMLHNITQNPEALLYYGQREALNQQKPGLQAMVLLAHAPDDALLAHFLESASALD